MGKTELLKPLLREIALKEETAMQRDEGTETFAAVFAEMTHGGRETAPLHAPAFCIEADGKEEVSVSLLGVDGQTERLLTCTPAELLLRAVEIDYTQLRDEVMRMWEQYPLDGYDRAAKKEELAHLLEEVRESAELLRESDPLGYFYVVRKLEANEPQLETALASEDVDLMEAGALLLNILEEPAMAQVRLRNVFEVAFDGMARATQRERFERLTSTYPSVADRHFPMRRLVGKGDAALSATHVEYRVEELDELYQLLLMLYFSQGKQRIVRCECCFGYFIPKSSRPTIYCDRVINGKSCKAAGSGLKYLAAMDRDAALRIYDTLRHRRASEYSDLLAVSVDEDARDRIRAYDAWDAEARAAREAYVKGGIDAAEFLRRIGYDGEAELTATSDPGKSEWRRRVERSIDFDPWMEYRGMMTLDLTADAPRWEITSTAEQVREAQGEHRSLRDRYGKK